MAHVVTFDEETHSYALLSGEPVPSVTTILQSLNNFGAVPMDVLHNAALRGTQVHKLCELYDLGETTECDARLIPYVEAWVRFRNDTGFVPDAIEERVYHPLHHYAGTLDRAGVLFGRRAIVDLKTSHELSPVAALQTAAYLEAWNHQRPRAGRAVRRYAVQLKKDGTYYVQEYSDSDDFETFLSALALHQWKSRVERK